MRVMGEVQTGGSDHQYIIPVADSSVPLVDLWGEGSRYRRSRFSLTSLFSLALFRAVLRVPYMA